MLNGHGYVSVILGGLLFSLGFTTPFAIAIFVTAAPDVHPLLAAPIAGTGALLADMTIFRCARLTLTDEFRRLGRTAIMRRITEFFHRVTVTERIRMYVLWSVVGFVIASPLPDEMGVTLLSGVRKIDARVFAVTSFVLNTVGVYLMLMAARAV
jgi:hypothetical protein